jgi:hypothetical protein
MRSNLLRIMKISKGEKKAGSSSYSAAKGETARCVDF